MKTNAGLMVTVMTLSLIGLPSVSALAVAGNQANAPARTYGSQPSNTGKTGGPVAVLVDLGATIDVPLVAGQSEVISSVLRVGNASVTTEVSQVAACREPGAAHDLTDMLSASESGRNVPASVPLVQQTSRFIFTAPDTAVFACSLGAVFINHTCVCTNGTIGVLSGSYILDVKGPLLAHAQTYGPQKLVTSRYDDDIIAGYTVPVGVNTLNVVGDFEITDCYATEAHELCGTGSAGSTSLTSQLFVEQLGTNGAPCVTPMSDTLQPNTVTDATHHFKIGHVLNNVPISAASACGGSRKFEVFVRLTWTSGNFFETEATNESNSYLYDAS